MSTSCLAVKGSPPYNLALMNLFLQFAHHKYNCSVSILLLFTPRGAFPLIVALGDALSRTHLVRNCRIDRRMNLIMQKRFGNTALVWVRAEPVPIGP